MWLLDVNLPVRLVDLLSELGITADTAEARGWKTLVNGELVEAAVNAGFTALLTKDQSIAESAAKALKRFPEFSAVRVLIPQLKGAAFLYEFKLAWQREPIKPIPGGVISWPS